MNQSTEVDVLIIGAGLSGLTSAFHLLNKGKRVTIVEAQNRVGGRILTAGIDDGKPFELGATWLGSKHVHLQHMLQLLQIEVFEQNMGSKAIFEPISTSPPYLASLNQNAEPSFRIKGGTETLINALVNQVGKNNIICSEKIQSINLEDQTIRAVGSQLSFTAKNLITTLPPNLLVNTVDFNPTLPEKLTDIAKNTHTWMDNSIKVGLSYKQAFWNTQQKSGTIMSNVGPVHEMYEHNDYENKFFALKGFLNGNYYNLNKAERKEKVLKQLRKYYGPEVDDYNVYYEKVWREETSTFYPYDNHIVPHQNHGHQVYQSSYWNNQLIVSGSETSSVFPGYMEGAIYSGLSAAKLLCP